MTQTNTISTDGILAPNGMSQYSRQFRAKLLSSTRKAMHEIGKEYKAKIQTEVEAKLNVKRKAFTKSFTYKVYFQRTDRIPSLHFYSRVPWVGIQDKGGSINKAVMIPLAKKRLGYKTFKDIVRQLRQGNNLFFDKRGGTTIAYAKNTKQFSKLLTPFKSVTSARTGQRIKKDDRVNIAVVKRRISLAKKINFTQLVNEATRKIVARIQVEMNR